LEAQKIDTTIVETNMTKVGNSYICIHTQRPNTHIHGAIMNEITQRKETNCGTLSTIVKEK